MDNICIPCVLEEHTECLGHITNVDCQCSCNWDEDELSEYDITGAGDLD
jgi:hypothetical protein